MINLLRYCVALMVAFSFCGALAEGIRTDFVMGTGLDGWSMSEGVYVSPTYSNSVSQISLEYVGESPTDKGSIYAISSAGEMLVTTLTTVSSAATFYFHPNSDFRAFRIAVEGDLRLKAFEVIVPEIQFKACCLSALMDFTYSQDFDSLALITSTTGDKTWQNWVTLPYWQAWSNDTAIFSFNYNAGKAANAGFYVLAGKQSDAWRSFGAHPKQGVIMSWGMAFTNDTDDVMILKSVSYQEQQWGFSNTNEHDFTCSWLVTNRFDTIVNFSEGWNDCRKSKASVYDKESQQAPVENAVVYMPTHEIRIAPGELLFLRWQLPPPSKGASALMAIDDLHVVFASATKPLVIRICTTSKERNSHVP